ncbi:uncharacterized protein Hap1MRO34_018797 [Clarias gariepinus]|uniref:ZW10 interactor n=1 Tax=Clarias gariepinus TaxID=13013 RepID=UPI00234E2551|nr:ZW10 interactor [Clarias gariepinus]
MVTERAIALLERADSFLLKPCDSTETQDAGGAKVMASYLMDCRRKQKIMCKQYGAVDEMIRFLAGLESAEQFLNEPCPSVPNTEANWKALKAEYLEQVQEVNGLIEKLVEQMEELVKKQQTLEALLVALEKKKQEFEEHEKVALKSKQRVMKQMNLQIDDSLQRTQDALHACDRQLSELKRKADERLAQVANWTALRDRLQSTLETTQAYMQSRLLSVSLSELCLELLPRSTQESLEPLHLSITMTTDDHFRLQVFQGTAGLLEQSVEGHVKEMSAALVEVMKCYISQGKMLAEIQALHSRFAIDWCPAKRLLIFLKSATTVCHLELEDGYPSNGRAKLLAVRKDGNLLNLSALQPPVMNPTLTGWLEFLSSYPDF